ncbi:ribosome recycling factor [Candidatus Peregrinibacteria bacterium]|nr:ribosome recycling factor [Candidatus Peregrinibacteria bacterium]
MSTTQEYISIADQEFFKALQHLKNEYSKLQTGRASPALVEDLKIEAYGGLQPLKGLASVSVPDPKTLQIQPWDRGILGAIERAIQAGNLGLNPINDGRVIRLPMPPLTEERRKELAKAVHQMAENAKISVRNARAVAHGAFKTMQDSKEISEDERRLSEKHLQEKVDKANKDIEELAKKKSEEVMTI